MRLYPDQGFQKAPKIRTRGHGARLPAVHILIMCGVVLNGIPSIPAAEARIIIAHRGASGYLPEHTLAAKAMAYAMGADYLEQDIVLSQDNVPVVLHDIQIDTVTDVARRFPERKREDGRYYAVDFTLAELRQLKVTERLDPRSGKPVFPNRFPAWHRQQGRDPSRIVLETLARHGYKTKADPVYVQCFEYAGAIRAVAQKEIRQIFPQAGWVEHDPRDWEEHSSVRTNSQ